MRAPIPSKRDRLYGDDMFGGGHQRHARMAPPPPREPEAFRDFRCWLFFAAPRARAPLQGSEHCCVCIPGRPGTLAPCPLPAQAGTILLLQWRGPQPLGDLRAGRKPAQPQAGGWRLAPTSRAAARSAEGGSLDAGTSVAGAGLAGLFEPPRSIVFQGTFEEAKEAALKKSQWLVRRGSLHCPAQCRAQRPSLRSVCRGFLPSGPRAPKPLRVMRLAGRSGRTRGAVLHSLMRQARADAAPAVHLLGCCWILTPSA